MDGRAETMDGRADRSSITVVIPVYNGAHFVAKAIDSVLAQTLPAAEVLVINDGSTDNIEEVAGRYGSAVTLVSQPNGGLSNARNTGIRLAQSKYVAFLDADDWWDPRKLELHAAAMEANPEACANYTGVRYVDAVTGAERVGAPVPLARLKRLVQWCNPGVPPSSLLMSKEALDEVGYFNEGVRACEDWDMWFRLCEGRRPLTVTEEPVTFYLVSPKSMSGNADLMYENFLLILDGTLLKSRRGWDRWIWRRRILSFQAYVAVLTARAEGKGKRERMYMVKSLMAWPSPFWASIRFKAFAVTLLRSWREPRRTEGFS
jgi:glycosyltransferase involved in cell wall biosynthesis